MAVSPPRPRRAALLARPLFVAGDALVLVYKRDLAEAGDGHLDPECLADAPQLAPGIGEQVLVPHHHAPRRFVRLECAKDDARPVAPDAGLPANQRLPPVGSDRIRALV